MAGLMSNWTAVHNETIAGVKIFLDEKGRARRVSTYVRSMYLVAAMSRQVGAHLGPTRQLPPTIGWGRRPGGLIGQHQMRLKRGPGARRLQVDPLILGQPLSLHVSQYTRSQIYTLGYHALSRQDAGSHVLWRWCLGAKWNHVRYLGVRTIQNKYFDGDWWFHDQALKRSPNWIGSTSSRSVQFVLSDEIPGWWLSTVPHPKAWSHHVPRGESKKWSRCDQVYPREYFDSRTVHPAISTHRLICCIESLQIKSYFREYIYMFHQHPTWPSCYLLFDGITFF